MSNHRTKRRRKRRILSEYQQYDESKNTNMTILQMMREMKSPDFKPYKPLCAKEKKEFVLNPNAPVFNPFMAQYETIHILNNIQAKLTVIKPINKYQTLHTFDIISNCSNVSDRSLPELPIDDFDDLTPQISPETVCALNDDPSELSI